MLRKLGILTAVMLLVSIAFADEPPIEPEAVQKFSFVIIADTHIGDGIRTSRNLGEMVRLINSIRLQYNIRYVFVVGDIAAYNDYQNPAHFDEAIDTLNLLNSNIEWIPLIGNHDILYDDNGNNGNGYMFYNKFQPQYNHLANSLYIKNWKKQPMPIYYGGRYYYLENFSFDYYLWGRYFHFLCLDWVKRSNRGREAWLNSLGGQGTYPWYWDDLHTWTYRNDPNGLIFLFAHHPCFYTPGDPWNLIPWAFGFKYYWDYDEVTYVIWEFNEKPGGYAADIDKWFNGHWHHSWHNYPIYYPVLDEIQVGTGSMTESNSYVPPPPEEYRDHGVARLVTVYWNGNITYSLIYGGGQQQKLFPGDILMPEHTTQSDGTQSTADALPISANCVLSQNYPNPASRVTSIRYSISATTYVTLKVYDVSGHLVKTLIEGRQSEGIHTVVWDCTNASGERVAPGVYFYRLATGEFTETKKMMMVK